MLTGTVCIKIIGAVCVISGCAGTGFLAGRACGLRYRQLMQLRQTMILLRGEIRYAHSELGEAFEHVAARSTVPFSVFLTELAGELSAMQGQPFALLWEKCIRNHLSESYLSGEDIQALIRLGGQLGYLDREMQLAAIDLYLEDLSTSIKDVGRTMGQKQKVSLSLGILSGFLLTVIFV